jgi:hypothetical protein
MATVTLYNYNMVCWLYSYIICLYIGVIIRYEHCIINYYYMILIIVLGNTVYIQYIYICDIVRI